MRAIFRPRVEESLAAMRDEGQPSSARLKAAVEAAPMYHNLIPPVIVTTMGPPMSRAEWLAAARDDAIGDEVK